jgi:hypothetical protein
MYETNNLADTGIRHEDTTNVTLDWNDPELAAIIRIRFLSDPGFPMFDVSYALGRTTDGDQCRVRLPRGQYGKRTYLSELYADARADGIRSLNRLCGGHVRDVISRMS